MQVEKLIENYGIHVVLAATFVQGFRKQNMKTCVIIFAKYPIPNHVKTRLIPYLSPEQAAELYAVFLADWCQAIAELSGVARIIAYTPPEKQAALQALIAGDATYIPQVGTGLGSRLISATQWASGEGYERIIIVGSDSPTLPLSYVSEAIVILATRDIVIGPSIDGGYYLIGFSSPNISLTVPFVFQEIPWSTSSVFEQTVARACLTDATLGLLPPWYDVDTPADVAFLKAHLAAMRVAGDKLQAVSTERLLSEL